MHEATERARNAAAHLADIQEDDGSGRNGLQDPHASPPGPREGGRRRHQMTRLLPHKIDFTAEGTRALLNRENGDRAVRLRIAELEGLLVRVRSIGAVRIAESCTWQRGLEDARASARLWADKAAIALAAGREDLANAALAEKRRAQDESDFIKLQIDSAIPQIREFESDLAQIEYALSCLKQDPNVERQLEL
jgi:hypothetical protein